MRISPLWTALIATLLAAGCPPPAAGPTGAPRGDLCNASLPNRLLWARTAPPRWWRLRACSLARSWRILRPGQMVTKEFNAQRLNLEVDANGRIVAVRCG